MPELNCLIEFYPKEKMPRRNSIRVMDLDTCKASPPAPFTSGVRLGCESVQPNRAMWLGLYIVIMWQGRDAMSA
jgi:hypothetical protein